MGDVSEHFSRHQFACKCGCGFNTLDAEVVAVAEVVQAFVEYPITPGDACQCKAHNETSLHLKGKAIDLPVKDPIKVYGMLCDKYPDRYGFAVHDTFVHIDIRDKIARFDNRAPFQE